MPALGPSVQVPKTGLLPGPLPTSTPAQFSMEYEYELGYQVNSFPMSLNYLGWKASMLKTLALSSFAKTATQKSYRESC